MKKNLLSWVCVLILGLPILAAQIHAKSGFSAALLTVTGTDGATLGSCSPSMANCGVQITQSPMCVSQPSISITNRSKIVAKNIQVFSADPNFSTYVVQNNGCPASLYPGASCTISFSTNTPTVFFIPNVVVKGTNTKASYFDIQAFACGLPGAPTNATASAGYGSATVTWSAPASNGDSPISGYTVYSSPGNLICTTTGATTCTVLGLTAGISYTFTVTATNAIGTGPASSPSNAVIPFYPTETLLYSSLNPSTTGAAVTLSAQVISVKGTPTAGTVSFTANGVEITGCAAVALTSGTATCTTMLLPSGLNANAIVANYSGVSGFPASTSATFNQYVVDSLIQTTPPGVPTNVTATPGNNQASISWLPPANTGGSAITGYTVTYGVTTATPTSSSYTTSGCTTTGAVSCVVGGLTNGTSYTFMVTATNSSGTGFPAFSSPAAPALLAVSPAIMALAVNGRSRIMTLTNNSASPVVVTQTPTTADFSPSLPAGTTLTPLSCLANTVLAANGGFCTLLLTPGATVSSDNSSASCTTGVAPVSSVLGVNTGAGPVSVGAVVLGNGCIYQAGNLFALNDTTPITSSVGGTVVYPNPDPQGYNIGWGLNSFDSVWGVDDTSSIVTPSPNTSSSAPATYKPGQLNCDAINDGLCATNNSFALYGPTDPNNFSTYYVAGYCKLSILGYIDWYAPSICELGPFGTTGEETGDYPTLPGSQACLSSDNIQNNLMGIPNFASTIAIAPNSYWSSNENSLDTLNVAWGQDFSSIGGYQAGATGDKFHPDNYLRCTRRLTI